VGTFAFLFTDIEGSTALLQRVRDSAYVQILAVHHAVIRSALADHGGREVDTAGDGFFAVFSSPRDCVAAALDMQRVLAASNWPGGEPVRVRMGVHCGQAEQMATGLVGVDVHRAARITAVAHGGQVVVSETAAALVSDALPPGASLRDLGLHRLKDLGRPLQLFQLCGPGLQDEFPSLRSLGSPALPNNLPGELTAFVGRDLEMTEVRALVESNRLVTLAGAGGAGKTRLGLQVAADFLDGSGDGVWLVELAPVTDEDAVAAAVAEALRIPLQSGRPAVDVVADALAPQDILIVLDNCEHLIGGCAKTADALLRRCPRVHLIATSREPLGIGGETIYRVPSLSLPAADQSYDEAAVASSDAVALLTARAEAQGVSLAIDASSGPLMVTVCRNLDGMPLAIELAAARLRSMSLVDLAARLDQRFRLLTGGSRSASHRQQTLLAAITWSYSLLTSAEQVLLRRLAVFAGGFDLAGAEAVCGFGAVDALDIAVLLGSLVDKSLVAAEPADGTVRYRLLESIRLFAADRLADAGAAEAAAAAAAHCAHYLDLAETAAPYLFTQDRRLWRTRLDVDQPNIRRAVAYATAQPDGTSLVLRFGVALWRYWATRYAGEEASRLLVPALSRPDAAAEPALFAEALVAAARAIVATDLPASLQLAEQAAEVAGTLGDERVLILSLGTLCMATYSAGNIERARHVGEESVTRARRLGNDMLLGMSLRAYLLAVDPAESAELYTEALACTERAGDLGTNAALHNNAGNACLERGDFDGASAHLQTAIEAADASGHPSPTARGNLGCVLRAQGDLDGALSMFKDALRLSRRVGDNRSKAFIVHGLALLAGDQGDWQRAAMLHGAAQTLLDKTGHPWESADAHDRQESLDRIAAALGQPALRQALAQGGVLSFEQVTDLALGKTTAG
jgi:predicted ATPase/class 3 adenylate cyclase